VVLAFCPADWSHVCGDQMAAVDCGADGLLDALERLANEVEQHGQVENADHVR